MLADKCCTVIIVAPVLRAEKRSRLPFLKYKLSLRLLIVLLASIPDAPIGLWLSLTAYKSATGTRTIYASLQSRGGKLDKFSSLHTTA